MRILEFLKSYFTTAGPIFELTQSRKGASTAGTNTLANQTNAADKGEKDVDNPQSGQDYFDRVVRLLPAETTIVYASLSANFVDGPTDTLGNVVTFIACTLVTAILRFPLLTMESGRKQFGTYILNILICWAWLYAVGVYAFNFGERDDQIAWVVMLVLGAVLPALPIWKERPGLT